mmetsp:Transcript_8420/g.38293  ORF Transcript_8420/g.38293 Transcript_8420/m.38293 type:complete len:484 (+) Transcript_8420:63-1514(+)
MDTRKNAQYFQTTTQLASLHSCILRGLSEGGVHSARADGRARARRPTRVRTMEFTVCVTRGVDGDISTEVTRGGGPPGHAVAGGFFLGPYPLGPLGREGLDDGLDFGCFMSSLFGAISRRIVRPPPDIPPPEGVADLPIVRELVVRALAARVVADSTSFLPLTDPGFDPYRGSLKALGRLACVSRGYRDDVNDPYVVTRLLDGVAAPKWRDWAKAWRGVSDPEKRLETPQTPNPRTGLHRLTLGDVHALLRAENVAKYVIDASNVAHFDEHALPERVTWRPSTLRASVAFPPPPEPAPEPNPVIPEGLQKVRTELEKVRPKFTADVERNVTLMRERDALVDTLERNGEALREKFESRADSAGDVFVAAALLKPETSPFDFVDDVENGSGRPRRTMSAHKASQQNQLNEHRKQQHHNFHLVSQKGGRRGRGKDMLAAAQARGADPSPAPKRNVFERVMQKCAAPALGADPSLAPKRNVFERVMQ